MNLLIILKKVSNLELNAKLITQTVVFLNVLHIIIQNINNDYLFTKSFKKPTHMTKHLNLSEKLVNDPVDICNIFNDYFFNILSFSVNLLPSASTKFSDYLNFSNSSSMFFLVLRLIKPHLSSLKLLSNSVQDRKIFLQLS